jgi:hypothetical protein
VSWIKGGRDAIENLGVKVLVVDFLAGHGQMILARVFFPQPQEKAGLFWDSQSEQNLLLQVF